LDSAIISNKSAFPKVKIPPTYLTKFESLKMSDTVNIYRSPVDSMFLLLKPIYQPAKSVRYTNYIWHKSMKSDSCESGNNTTPACHILTLSITTM